MPPVRKAPSRSLPPSRSAQAVRQALRWGSEAEELSRSSRTPPSPVTPPEVEVASQTGASASLSAALSGPHVLMLPDLERADRIGEFFYPESRGFAERSVD